MSGDHMYHDLIKRLNIVLKKRADIPSKSRLAVEIGIVVDTLTKFLAGKGGLYNNTYLKIERWIEREEDKFDIPIKK